MGISHGRRNVLQHDDPERGLARAPNMASDKAHRRRFTAAYKAAILAKFEACRSAAERGALLRRDGLYRSHICKWLARRDAAALAGLASRKRGRKPKQQPRERELVRLNDEKARLERKLKQAELIVDIQKSLLRSSTSGADAQRRVELLMRAIEQHASELGIAQLCSALGVPRASYYRRQRRRTASDTSDCG